MRKVIVSSSVMARIVELRIHLSVELKLSEAAAVKRMDRIGDFLKSLGNPGDYALCRFRRWRKAGYRCALFEGWIFAYDVVPEGIIVCDMAHATAMKG